MSQGYSWQERRHPVAYRLPSAEHLGRWALAGLALSLVLHGIAFVALDRVRIAVGLDNGELSTGPIKVEQVDTEPIFDAPALPPERVVEPPKDTAKLLDEVDLLSKLPDNAELDMKPDVLKAEFNVAIANPVKSGSPQGLAPDPVSGFDVDADLPELGRMDTDLKPAAEGQVVIDPGSIRADDKVGSRVAEDILRQGGNGKAEQGGLEGSLDDLLGLPANVLVGKTTMLPSDLLFEYNRADLRQSAKVGLMKLGLLIDRNPKLHCWIEGHTDLYGGDDFNLELSRRRAEAVKAYLVQSLGLDSKHIQVRGFGKTKPLRESGTVDEQASNRRVEIKMRAAPAPAEAVVARTTPPSPAPSPAPAPMPPAPVARAVQEDAPAPKPVVEEESPRKAILVKPQRALPVIEEPPARAIVVPERPPLRAQAVEEPPARAQVIEE